MSQLTGEMKEKEKAIRYAKACRLCGKDICEYYGRKCPYIFKPEKPSFPKVITRIPVANPGNKQQKKGK